MPSCYLFFQDHFQVYLNLTEKSESLLHKKDIINMATAKITCKGGLRTEAVHLKSGSAIITDAPTDNRGQGAAFSPTDLVATALGSCILTIMGIKALDSGIDMEGATAEVEKVMSSNPRRISEIKVLIKMPANDYTDKEKKLLERAAHHCPVAKSLSENLNETIEIIFL